MKYEHGNTPTVTITTSLMHHILETLFLAQSGIWAIREGQTLLSEINMQNEGSYQFHTELAVKVSAPTNEDL